jgi:hypothetical protein
MKITYSEELRAQVVEMLSSHPETADGLKERIASVVSRIISRAFDGDIDMQGRLLNIYRNCYPELYKLPDSVQRVMAIRYRMAEFSSVVMPSRGNRFLPSKNAPHKWPLVRLREASIVEKIDGSSSILTDDVSFFSSELFQRAARHFRGRRSKNFTLQSFAFHDYESEHGLWWADRKRVFFNLMRQTREYEKVCPPKLYIELSSGELLPYYPFART